MRSFVLVLGLLLPCPSVALAGGLFTPDTGTVGLSRGGAWTARASDVAGALYYNPAGLWQVDGWTVSGGVNLYSADRTFQRLGYAGGPTYDLTAKRSHVRPHPEVGIAWGLPKPDLTFAIGLTSPLAPIQSFSPTGPGRYRIIEQVLEQGNIYFGAAFRPIKYVSVGATFQIVAMTLTESFAAQADVLADSNAPNPENRDWDVLAEFSARAVAPQFNIGVMVMPTDWLRIGVSFDPPYRFAGTGTVDISGAIGGESGAVQVFGDGPIYVRGEDDITLDVGLPGHLRFGLDVAPIPQLSFGLDAHFELWNGTGDITAGDIDMPLFYDNPDDDLAPEPLVDYLYRSGICPLGSVLGIDCGDASSLPAGAGSSLASYTGNGGEVVVPASYRNTWSIRTGVEAKPHPGVALRFGYLFESSAVGNETLSLTSLGGDKHMLAGGLSMRIGANERDARPVAEVSITYAHVWYPTRTVTPTQTRGSTLVLPGVPANPVDAGVYTADVNQVGLNVAFHFGALGQRLAEPVMRR
ncbi:MAG: outer membrane protein transport protein [Deltaproteobacteria bacterium]|nr:outer membrane protein transport protein [Deltaproteobacteria bacterium]